MKPVSARTLFWLSELLVLASGLGPAPPAALLATLLAAILAAIPLLFASQRLRMFAALLLVLSLLSGFFQYPAYKEHMARYRQHAEKVR